MKNLSIINDEFSNVECIDALTIIEKDEIILMIRIAISILLGVGGFILNKTIIEAWYFYIPLYFYHYLLLLLIAFFVH